MQDEWGRTSSVMALLANCHRDPKRSRAFRPKDFDPFTARGKPPKVSIEVLKEMFINRKTPKAASNRE